VPCPACHAPTPEPLFRRADVPAWQNVLLPNVEAARRAPRATLDLVGCPACGHVWNRTFDPSLPAYDHRYENRQDLSPRFLRHLHERADAITARAGPGRDIVEVGCGNGTFLAELCRRGGHRGVGFDTAYRGPDGDPGLRFVRSYYGPEWSFIPADVVVCRHVIEHVADPVGLLRSIRGALAGRPEALVWFECPDFAWICQQDAWWDVFHEHAQYFTASSLAAAFHRAGFAQVQVETVFEGQYLQAVARPSAVEPARPARTVSSPLSAARAWAYRTGDRASRWASLLDEEPVVVWGAGAKGVTFVTTLDPEQTRVKALIDVNPAKQGGFVPVTGHPIVGPDDLMSVGVRRILVLNPAYLDEVRAWCAGLPFHVVAPELPCDLSSMTKLAS
jgi:SAM-dependent methyltransferase